MILGTLVVQFPKSQTIMGNPQFPNANVPERDFYYKLNWTSTKKRRIYGNFYYHYIDRDLSAFKLNFFIHPYKIKEADQFIFRVPIKHSNTNPMTSLTVGDLKKSIRVLF